MKGWSHMSSLTKFPQFKKGFRIEDAMFTLSTLLYTYAKISKKSMPVP